MRIVEYDRKSAPYRRSTKMVKIIKIACKIEKNEVK